MSASSGPVVAFLCNWCAYAASDAAGASQEPLAADVRVVRVMCTGRVDAELVLQAFAQGAGGVLTLGCQPGSCHYKEQNYRGLQRERVLARILEGAGIDPRRLRFDFVAADQPDKFRQVAAEFSATVQLSTQAQRREG